MKNAIPKQLMNPDFKFFLVGTNKKTPIECRWNTENCYMFFEKKLLNHISNGGNAGICTGYGSLIVIDFDVKDYQDLKEPMLLKTFTVKTAIKGLHHLYYILDGIMIKKIGIGMDPRLADIQAGKDGIVIPPSSIKDKCYTVINDRPIAHIDYKTLNRVFGIKDFKESRRRKFKEEEPQPKKIQEAIDLFKQLGIPRTNQRHFKCPFHRMSGNGNLYVFNDGSIYCFHCQISHRSAKDFKAKWQEVNGDVVII